MQNTKEKISTNQIKLLVVDDHKIFSKLISNHLERRESVNLVGIAYSYQEALDIASSIDIDVCLLDVMLPDGSGIDLARDLLIIKPDLKIIFLTAMNSKDVIVQAVKLGAVGFLSKTSKLEEIHDAISFATKNERYFCQESLKVLVGNKVDDHVRSMQIASSTDLTQREKEILQLILDEYTISDIADKLHVSPRTIQTHKKNIMTKLDVNTTVALIKMIYEKKLLD